MYTQGVNPPGGDHHNGHVYIAQCVSAHLSPIITTSLPEQIVFAAVRMHFIRGQPLQLFCMTQNRRKKLPAFLRASLFLSVSLILGQSVLNFYCFAHFLQLRWSQCTQVVGAVTRCHNVIKVLRESSPCNKNSVPYNKGINFIALSTPSTNIYPRFVHWYSTAIIRSLKGYDIILKSSIWSAS